MSQVALESLLHRAHSGDEKAENEIFQFLFPRFKRFAKRKIQEDNEAEDIAQEACLTILKKYKSEQFSVSFQAWSYGVLKMKIGNYLQKSNVRKKVMTDCNDDSRGRLEGQCINDPDLKRRMMHCIKLIMKKNHRYARTLNLIHHGYTSREISSKMEISLNNCYSILSHGRSMLRKCLESGRL